MVTRLVEILKLIASNCDQFEAKLSIWVTSKHHYSFKKVERENLKIDHNMDIIRFILPVFWNYIRRIVKTILKNFHFRL